MHTSTLQFTIRIKKKKHVKKGCIFIVILLEENYLINRESRVI